MLLPTPAPALQDRSSMFSRALRIPLLMAAAVGVPYVATNGPELGDLLDFSSANQAGSDPGGTAAGAHSQQPISPTQGPGSVLYPVETPLEGVKDVSLDEIFRLDVSKEWVYRRWSRKSTALSELGLYGIRVALVTGTELHDLAGSLTYFFGQDGRVQRISFRGRTGDTTQLVKLAVGRFGLQQQASAIVGEQLFQIRRGDQVFSELRTRPTSVLWASSPHDSFLVNFELQRGDATTPLRSQLELLGPAAAKAAAAEQVNAAAQQNSPDQAASVEEKVADVKSGGQTWKAFFPRSRVPREQVESLDQRERLW